MNRSSDSATVSSVSWSSSDLEIANTFAPVLYLSGPGGEGVDMSDDSDYTDYIPVNVNDLTSNEDSPIYFVLAEDITFPENIIHAGRYPVGTYSLDDLLGLPEYRSSENYLDFSPLLGDNDNDAESGYQSLSLNPTVYFKVFKNDTNENPIAIQYWFFYVYNDWGLINHPGDWETITIFLDTNSAPIEVAYSTHYEANRHSWQVLNDFINVTHPPVYVSNGGHGSYINSAETPYTFDIAGLPIAHYSDNHLGDREVLFPSGMEFSMAGRTSYPYDLIDLASLESNNGNWILFEGRWGDVDSAPNGPHFRTDVPTDRDYGLTNNPPEDPYNNCEGRLATNIYGDDGLDVPTLTVTTSGINVSLSWTSINDEDEQHFGPWYWASGYGLDGAECQTAECQSENATGYTLYYVPYPYTGPETIESLDMGTETSISDDLWEGAEFLVAVRAYNCLESSEYSNIEYFELDCDGIDQDCNNSRFHGNFYGINTSGNCVGTMTFQFGNDVSNLYYSYFYFPDQESLVSYTTYAINDHQTWTINRNMSISGNIISIDEQGTSNTGNLFTFQGTATFSSDYSTVVVSGQATGDLCDLPGGAINATLVKADCSDTTSPVLVNTEARPGSTVAFNFSEPMRASYWWHISTCYGNYQDYWEDLDTFIIANPDCPAGTNVQFTLNSQAQGYSNFMDVCGNVLPETSVNVTLR
jgi:hypothetical protein